MKAAPQVKSSSPATSKTASVSGRGTRDVILETALRTVAREGLQGLTIGELAKAVGMSKSGLFAHFGGKDQLQIAVLERAVARFVDIVMRPAFKVERGEPRITAVFENWLAHLSDKSALPGGSILIAASTELDDQPGPQRDFVHKAQKDLISNIEKSARMAVDEGHFRKNLDVEQFAWTMYSFVLGYYHFRRMLEDPKAELHLKRSFSALVDASRSETKSDAKARRKKVRRKK